MRAYGHYCTWSDSNLPPPMFFSLIENKKNLVQDKRHFQESLMWWVFLSLPPKIRKLGCSAFMGPPSGTPARCHKKKT